MDTNFSIDNLQELLIYRNILQHPVLKTFEKLLKAGKKHPKKARKLYSKLASQLAQEQIEQELQGNLWTNFIVSQIWQDENFYTRFVEQTQPQFSSLSAWVQHDLRILKELLFFNWDAFSVHAQLPPLPANTLEIAPLSPDNLMQQGIRALNALFSSSAMLPELFCKLNDFYRQYGCGIFAGHLAFQWKHGLKPIPNPSLPCMSDLIGCDYQKSVLLENTRAFVQGRKANHVLLYGEKGTGKSTSVKALLREFASEGLRMVEISRQQFPDFAAIMETIKDRRFRFILFVDDLSFEASDSDYKYVKSCIEGSLEHSADNVLIYATSNRRHLIRENWSDRQETDDEVHISDTHQEKLSLSDRFGIALSYYTPDKEQYLKIVSALAKRENIEMPEEELRSQAMQWEKLYHGYSGRSARQFVNSLCARQTAAAEKE